MPLTGIRVLDFTQVVAGPFCTQMLGDMGAEVIKVESLAGDRSRTLKEAGEEAGNSFLNVNRNKKSLAVDLKHPDGKALIWELLATADVLVENFKPGTMERLGFGYPALKERFPALVYCSISGFGQTGPRRGEVAFDQIIQGYSGIMGVTGTTETGPLRVGGPVADLIGGSVAAQGVLLALLERHRSHLGQWVDVAMLDALIPMLGFTAWEFLNRGTNPGRNGNAHPTLTPSGSFRASDGPFNISITGDVMWKRFCAALGQEGWPQDPRFVDNTKRMANRAELTELIERRLAEKTREEWFAHFRRAEVPCGPILEIEETFADPQVKARQMVHTIDYPGLGTAKLVANPIKLNRTPARYDRLPPQLGADADEVLGALGFSDEKIRLLREKKALG